MRAPGYALALLALAGCEAASSDPGYAALLQVADAQFRPGGMPPDRGGPAALVVSTQHARIPIGSVDEQIRGVLDPSARVAVIGIDGVEGTWLVPAGVADLDTPGQPTAKARIGVAPEFPPGPFTLVVTASDEHGRFGAPATVELIADEVPPPTGELVIALVWDGPADLDLHVVEPDGGEAWSDKPNTMRPPAPGTPVDPAEYLKHGILDHDGNKDCHREGMPREHVIWQMPPPGGEYLVRVDTPSLCGAASAAWYVAVYRAGDPDPIAAARGISTPADVLEPRGAGAGVLALRFSL
ncbi:MAG: hypothetical protein JWP01_3053 [Myxococcales bacterium]|nr:hypothetical protein [Myxococcales bacterium]